MRVYRQGGLKGLAEYGVLTSEISSQLRTLWQTEADCEPANAQKYEWLSLYQKAGRQTLFRYLGTPHEINFGELSAILSQFHQGADHIYLKRMGREEESLWYDKVDFTQTRVLIVEDVYKRQLWQSVLLRLVEAVWSPSSPWFTIHDQNL